jgi:hypothetical protein
MTQPQQHYDVTDGDFDFIWKNIDSPLVVRDRINVIKTRSHPYQNERDKMLDELDTYLDVELERASQFNAMRNFALLEVKRKIKELRQQAGES